MSHCWHNSWIPPVVWGALYYIGRAKIESCWFCLLKTPGRTACLFSLGVFVVANMQLLRFIVEENHKDTREDIISVLPGVPLVSVIINLVFFVTSENHNDTREDIISAFPGVSLVSVVINLLCNYYRYHKDIRDDNISVFPDGSSVYVVIKTVISITTKTTRDTAILPSLLSLWSPL